MNLSTAVFLVEETARAVRVEYDPDVARNRLLSVRAPEIIIAHSAQVLEDRVATFRALHPGSVEDGTA